MEINTQSGEEFRFSYKFSRDAFVNTVILEISQERTFYPLKITPLNNELRIEAVRNLDTSTYSSKIIVAISIEIFSSKYKPINLMFYTLTLTTNTYTINQAPNIFHFMIVRLLFYMILEDVFTLILHFIKKI